MTAPLLYLDNNATTRLAPEARAAMEPWLGERWGNPSSSHGFGRAAAEAVAVARRRVARLIQAHPAELVFTSGGTEAINTAIAGALAARAGRRRVVTSTVEHSATRRPLERHAAAGVRVERVPVDARGVLDVDAALRAIDAECALVTLILGNNETGVVLADDAVRALGAACRAHDVALHLDAVQVVGKLPLAVGGPDALPLDLVSISAHKLHGPMGVGALWVRPGTALEPLLLGGPQESERRAGTLNVPGIVGFGRAAELAGERLARPEGNQRLRELRDRLADELLEHVPGARVNGAGVDGAQRLPGTLSIVLPGVEGEALLMLLSELGVAASTGSACDAERREPSPTLLAMGLSAAEAAASLRLSLSHETTAEDVARAARAVRTAHEALRALAPR